MQRKVDEVIAAHIETAQCVVDREREIHQRAARRRQLTPREQDGFEVPPLADLLVVDDRDEVVENERPGEAAGVRQQSAQNDDARAQPDAGGRFRWQA